MAKLNKSSHVKKYLKIFMAPAAFCPFTFILTEKEKWEGENEDFRERGRERERGGGGRRE